jgi:hypothetical protein
MNPAVTKDQQEDFMRSFSHLTIAAALALGIASTAYADDDSCNYAGANYSDGSVTCQGGKQFECDEGQWESLDSACTAKTSEKSCDFNGVRYSSGSASCQSGTHHRCEDGTWKSLSVACPADFSAPRAGDAPPTCMMDGGATVGSGSTVCRMGTMYACDSGNWRNLGTPCQ